MALVGGRGLGKSTLLRRLQTEVSAREIDGRSVNLDVLRASVAARDEAPPRACFVEEAGGKVLGSVRVPLNSMDFSSYLLQAQSSGAKVIGLANAGGDFINSTKQASEFGLTHGGQSLAALVTFITEIRSLGLGTAQVALTTMVVMLPLIYLSGELRSLFLPFGLLVALTLATSLASAALLVPVLARFLPPPEVRTPVRWLRKASAAPYYVVARFSATPDQLPEYERALKLDDAVLRHLVVLDEGAQMSVPPSAKDGEDE